MPNNHSIFEKLAIHGGVPVRTAPYPTGARFGDAELELVREALNQNTLFYFHGKKVKEFNEKFAAMYGMKYCVATSSGTAAIHAALGAVGVTEGDEVITTPITDMGSIIGILYQNAIPVFCDLEPHTYGMDPKSFKSCITDKTKAVVVVHLAGNPCDMDPIMEIARRRGIYVIEDCAQSYNCWYKGKLAGTFGDIGCFSTNDYKHITTGDGGMMVMNNDELYEIATRFVDKNYDRNLFDMRKIAYIAPNYRMTELQGAVGIAQLDRLEWICESRRKYGDAITEGIKGIKGVYPHKVETGNKCSYWFYMFRVFEEEAGVCSNDFCKALAAEGIKCGPESYGMIYDNELFAKKSAYRGTNAPFDSRYYGKDIEYKLGICPMAENISKTGIRMPVNEFFTEQESKDVITGIKKVAAYYAKLS